jgi:hypothetical protein
LDWIAFTKEELGVGIENDHGSFEPRVGFGLVAFGCWAAPFSF